MMARIILDAAWRLVTLYDRSTYFPLTRWPSLTMQLAPAHYYLGHVCVEGSWGYGAQLRHSVTKGVDVVVTIVRSLPRVTEGSNHCSLGRAMVIVDSVLDACFQAIQFAVRGAQGHCADLSEAEDRVVVSKASLIWAPTVLVAT